MNKVEKNLLFFVFKKGNTEKKIIYIVEGEIFMKNEIILFENQDVKLEVNMQDETVWLNAEQMSKLFDRDTKTIRKHINNVLLEELKDEEVVAKFATTTKHGAVEGKTQIHIVDYYNLDMIISVGYREKSKNGIIFHPAKTLSLDTFLC